MLFLCDFKVSLSSQETQISRGRPAGAVRSLYRDAGKVHSSWPFHGVNLLWLTGVTSGDARETSLSACRFRDVLLQNDRRASEPTRLQTVRPTVWGVARSSRTKLVSGVEGTPSFVATTWGVYGTGLVHVRRASLRGAVGYSRPDIARGQTALIRTRALMLCIDKL